MNRKSEEDTVAFPDERTFHRRMGKALRQLRQRAGFSLEEAGRVMKERGRDPSEYRVGEILRRFRQRSGLSLEEVARRMGKEPSAWREIASWERDECSGSLYDIALYLKVVDATFDELQKEWRARKGEVS